VVAERHTGESARNAWIDEGSGGSACRHIGGTDQILLMKEVDLIGEPLIVDNHRSSVVVTDSNIGGEGRGDLPLVLNVAGDRGQMKGDGTILRSLGAETCRETKQGAGSRVPGVRCVLVAGNRVRESEELLQVGLEAALVHIGSAALEVVFALQPAEVDATADDRVSTKRGSLISRRGGCRGESVGSRTLAEDIRLQHDAAANIEDKAVGKGVGKASADVVDVIAANGGLNGCGDWLRVIDPHLADAEEAEIAVAEVMIETELPTVVIVDLRSLLNEVEAVARAAGRIRPLIVSVHVLLHLGADHSGRQLVAERTRRLRAIGRKRNSVSRGVATERLHRAGAADALRGEGVVDLLLVEAL